MSQEDQEKKLKLYSAISRIHNIIGADLALEEISRILVKELVNILGCAGCALLLVEEGKVRILAERGFSRMLGEGEFSTSAPLIKHVSEMKQSIHTGDIANSPGFNHLAAGCYVKSLICAPITVKDQVRGIIALDSPDENAFAEEDLHFVELLAKGMSIAMERSLLYSQVKVLTIKDSLTGCYNRKKLVGDLEVEVARAKRYNRPLSLLLITVEWVQKRDMFHGHTKGDELLKEIASIIRHNVRMIDKIYRSGEREFVILLPETTEERALVVANRLVEIITQKRFEGEQESQPGEKVAVSVGMADYPGNGNDAGELLKSLAAALSQVKKSGGKDQVTIEKAK